MTGATYDAGALIAIERQDNKMVNFHRSIVKSGITPVVPAGVLAQVWRGGSGRQAPLARALNLNPPFLVWGEGGLGFGG